MAPHVQTHFWFPGSLFAVPSGGVHGVVVQQGGDGKPCPPPGHPQNCSQAFLQWAPSQGFEPSYGNPLPLNTPVFQPPAGHAATWRSFGFKTAFSSPANTTAVLPGALWTLQPPSQFTGRYEPVNITNFPSSYGTVLTSRSLS